jgi:hypothetical protein
MKRPVGRPTIYNSSYVDKLEEYLREAIPENMDIPTVEGYALKVGKLKGTLYEWAKKHPEFNDALKKLKQTQKQHLIKIGIFGGKEVNATIVALLLKVNHNMIETQKNIVDANILTGPIPLAPKRDGELLDTTSKTTTGSEE